MDILSVAQNPVNNNQNKESTVDIAALVYMYLLDAVTINSHNAVVRAKQLQQNALSQEKMNASAAQLQWYNVPTADIVHQSFYITHHHTDFTMKNGYPVQKTWVTRQLIGTHTSFKNQVEVQQAEAKNQQVSLIRETITDRLVVLQQSAQIGESNVNSQSDKAMQAMQEGSQILDILKSLAFQAMMRPPVAN